ncbi:MAG: signal recognition particle-docking protein FtsY [Clostridiales bacterium]|jgi:fused signal recognition particle receptor|nr:signal recognition particle-docking protein FtsY [Clostridiales bacterium]MDY4654787.1 signal recognition particle-docking protein FtsY [Eubacteriales bacterium]
MGFFDKIKQGLRKTKDSISKKIFEAFKAKELNDEFYEELETALITSDMGVTATEQIIEDLKQVLFEKKITSPEKAKRELKDILVQSIDFEIPEYTYPLVILVAGINGVGKTTAVGKLANYFKSIGKSVVIAAADTFRAAASEQLEVWAERAGVRIIKHSEGSDPAAVVFDAIASQKAKNTDVILVDTAGRLHNKKNLMEELKKINRVIERELPDCDRRNYIVLDATTGQNAIAQVEIFDEAIDIDGIILTKLDGTAKGGVVMAIAAEYEMPVVYVGVGEKIDDLLPFNPEEFVDAVLD